MTEAQMLLNMIEVVSTTALDRLRPGPYRDDVLTALAAAYDALVCYQELGPDSVELGE